MFHLSGKTPKTCPRDLCIWENYPQRGLKEN